MSKPLVIYDNDLAGDFDGTVGLAVLFGLEKEGLIELYGVGLSDVSYWGPIAVDNAIRAILKREIPIGVMFDKEPDLSPKTHAKASFDKFGAKISWYLCQDVVRLFRYLLATAPDKSVILISAGPMTNIANLLKSEGDEIIELSGRELIEKKVIKYIAMAGDVHVTEFKEYNVRCDVDAARYVFDNFPRDVPLIVVDFRVPLNTLTGDIFGKAPDYYPIKAQWEWFGDPEFKRPSWDPYATLLTHPRWDKWFKLVGPGKIHIDNDGRTKFVKGGANQYYVEHKEGITNVYMRNVIHSIIERGFSD